MRSIHFQSVIANEVTEETVKTAPQRVLAFLQGAADKPVSAALATGGWTDEDAARGYGLIAALNTLPRAAPASAEPNVVAEAIAGCEEWQGGPLVRARAKLQFEYPAQAAYVFDDFVPTKGVAAVLNVTMVLARRTQLLADPLRKATRKVDREAVALLDKVAGLTKEEVKRLEKLVEDTHHVEDASAPDTSADTARLEALRALYAWLTAWSDIARTVITRRDYLIRLGLAKRRPVRSKAKPVTAPAATPPATTPAVTPPAVTPPAPAVTSSLDEHGPDSRAA